MQTKVIYSIYKHTCKTTSKSYIGKAGNVDGRKNQHHTSSKNKKSTSYNTYFSRAIRKYGIEDFTTTLLWQTPSEQTAYLAEVYFIALYDTFLGEGYNSNTGGKGATLGIPRTQKTKDKIKKTLTGKKFTKEHKDNLSKAHAGYKASQKTKDKMSKAHKGIQLSEEHKTIISKSNSKNYIITFPSGIKKKIKNLSNFCKEYNLCVSGMSQVAHGKRKSHKKFICSLK